MRQIRLGGDPFEAGIGAPAGFWALVGAQARQLTRHDVNHGEAVAIGIALDTRYSVMTGLLAEGEDRRVLDVLKRLGFTLWHDALRLQDADGGLVLLLAALRISRSTSAAS